MVDDSNFYLELQPFDDTVQLNYDKVLVGDWPMGEYTLRYQVGLVHENFSETLDRPMETVSFTLRDECEIFLPNVEATNSFEVKKSQGTSSYSYKIGQN